MKERKDLPAANRQADNSFLSGQAKSGRPTLTGGCSEAWGAIHRENWTRPPNNSPLSSVADSVTEPLLSAVGGGVEGVAGRGGGLGNTARRHPKFTR